MVSSEVAREVASRVRRVWRRVAELGCKIATLSVEVEAAGAADSVSNLRSAKRTEAAAWSSVISSSPLLQASMTNFSTLARVAAAEVEGPSPLPVVLSKLASLMILANLSES